MSLTESPPPKKLNRIYRWEEIKPFTGNASRVSVHEWIKNGEFPAPVKLGGGRAVGWLEDSLIAWQESRKVAA